VSARAYRYGLLDVDVDVDVDVDAALAGWMHRVRADLAGCNENSDYWMLRLRWLVACCGYVGRPSPMVTTGLLVTICLR
jgi:hypothetical protein